MLENLNIEISEIPDLTKLKESMDLIKYIMKEFCISQKKIAEKINMAESTFKLKFSDRYPQYKFKPSEIIQIIKIVEELKKKIELV